MRAAPAGANLGYLMRECYEVFSAESIEDGGAAHAREAVTNFAMKNSLRNQRLALNLGQAPVNLEATL